MYWVEEYVFFPFTEGFVAHPADHISLLATNNELYTNRSAERIVYTSYKIAQSRNHNTRTLYNILIYITNVHSSIVNTETPMLQRKSVFLLCLSGFKVVGFKGLCLSGLKWLGLRGVFDRVQN